jgi:hypothetical protein
MVVRKYRGAATSLLAKRIRLGKPAFGTKCLWLGKRVAVTK